MSKGFHAVLGVYLGAMSAIGIEGVGAARIAEHNAAVEQCVGALGEKAAIGALPDACEEQAHQFTQIQESMEALHELPSAQSYREKHMKENTETNGLMGGLVITLITGGVSYAIAEDRADKRRRQQEGKVPIVLIDVE